MANAQNLKPWQPGQSGNPAGKPRGTKHISTLVQEMLNDKNFSVNANGKHYRGAPLKAIIKAQIVRALDGDPHAFNVLMKQGWGKVDPPSPDVPANPIHFINNVPIGGDIKSNS